MACQYCVFLQKMSRQITYVVAHSEDALPSGDWVGADHWVDGLELGADVLGCATRVAVELETILLRGLLEAWLRVCGIEGVEELLVWR